MKKIILSMAAVSALAIGAPAAAQYQTQNSYQTQNGVNANGNLSARIDQLRVRIQAGVQSGAISRTEALPLRQQLRALTQLERQYSANGLSGQERSDLQQRLRTLREQVRTADGGANGRYDQYDRDNGYGQTGQYGNQSGQYGNGQYDRAYDRNNDGFDDRDLDRDGRWDDDARNGANNGSYGNGTYGNDDGYEQPATRGGLGGVIDNVLGRGGLRVGQRASGNLSAVPSAYRDQYRDSGSSYFRTDGRQIYQIDARTQTVVRVYAMNR